MGQSLLSLGAELGALAAEHPEPEVVGQALALLAEGLRADAAEIAVPVDDRHEPLATMGYPRAGWTFSEQFAASRWFSDIFTRPSPPTVSTDTAPTAYRDGPLFTELLRPAGFHDGMSAALFRRGTYLGTIHLSSGRPDAFDEQSSWALLQLLPAIAAVADLVGRRCREAGVPGSARAALLVGDRVRRCGDRGLPHAVTDARFADVVAEFAVGGADRLSLWWSTTHGFERLHLRSVPGVERTGRAVLVWGDLSPVSYGLTPRELDVLTWIALGEASQVIADELGISLRTVHTHVEHVLHKTGAATRTQAACLALREGLVRPIAGHPGGMGVLGLCAA